jgi:hypothetical protein
LVLQFVLVVYAWAIGQQSAPILFDATMLVLCSIVTLPLFLRASFHEFGPQAFTLSQALDKPANWFLYVLGEVADAVLAGVPGTYGIAFHGIEPSGRCGPTLITFARLVVIAQFLAVVKNAWDAKGKKRAK